METAIHIEIDLLCILILSMVAWQSAKNVNQQAKRVLFRYTVYGILCALILDILWIVIDGRMFPGGIFLNRIINAVFLSIGVLLSGIWYLYVLETLHFHLTKTITCAVMLPGILVTVLNLISIKTGWMFYVTEQNEYVRGSLYFIQMIGSVGLLFVSLIHIVVRLVRGDDKGMRRDEKKLLCFYAIPVVGTVLSLPFPGMPGTWTCAAVSLGMLYMSDLDTEIVKDSLTGLNNRKTLDTVFADYVRQISPEKRLFMFMMDLDDFKKINDTYGHTVGDDALVAAASVLRRSIGGVQGMVVRFGGDEFMFLGFFAEEEDVEKMSETIRTNIKNYSGKPELPCKLAMSVGYCEYKEGQTLKELTDGADEQLYLEKQKRKVGR